MKNKIEMIYLKYEHIAKSIFYAALTIELVIMMVGHSAFMLPYRGRLTHVAFVLFGGKVLLTKYTKKEWAVIILLGMIGSVSYFSADDEWVIRIIMMVVSSKGISLKTVIKYTFWMSLFGTIMIMGLSCFGIGGQMVDVRDYGRGAIEARWCLGFNHANNLHGTIWYVISLGLLTFRDKVRWYHGGILTLINVMLYCLTISRTGLIVTQLVIIAAMIYVYYPQMAKWNWIYILGIFGTIFCAGIGIYAVAFGVYGNVILEKMSTLLTGRLELLTWWETVGEWSLFGDARERKPVDVGFITLVSRYGYVIFSLYLVCILLMIYYQCRNKQWMEFVVLMTCVFYTFMESTYTINVYLLCNFTFLLLLGTWNRLLMKGRTDESIQSKK